MKEGNQVWLGLGF